MPRSGITKSVAQVWSVVRVTTSVTGWPAGTVTTGGRKPSSVTVIATPHTARGRARVLGAGREDDRHRDRERRDRGPAHFKSPGHWLVPFR